MVTVAEVANNCARNLRGFLSDAFTEDDRADCQANVIVRMTTWTGDDRFGAMDYVELMHECERLAGQRSLAGVA